MDHARDPFSFNGQRILVTGASSGLGRACAVFLSGLGARLVLSGRDERKLEATRLSLVGSGHVTSVFDLTRLEDISAWIAGLTADGPLSGLVHSAGVAKTLPVKATDAATFRQVMSVNTESAFALARAFRQKKSFLAPASIVFIASIAGIVGYAGLSAYSASKAAIIGMARSLAMEFARDGIRVNCVSPGFVMTEMTRAEQSFLTPQQVAALEADYPLGFGEPEDVASAVSFLLSASGKWITGSNLVIDGGASTLR